MKPCRWHIHASLLKIFVCALWWTINDELQSFISNCITLQILCNDCTYIILWKYTNTFANRLLTAIVLPMKKMLKKLMYAIIWNCREILKMFGFRGLDELQTYYFKYFKRLPLLLIIVFGVGWMDHQNILEICKSVQTIWLVLKTAIN